MKDELRQGRGLQASPVIRMLAGSGGITEREAECLEYCVTGGQVHRSGEVFIDEGARLPHAFVVRSGWAIRYTALSDGRRQILSFALPGDIIGLNAGAQDAACYSAAALTPLSLGVLSLTRLREGMRRLPLLGSAVAACTAREMHRLGEHALRLGRMTAYERMSHLILELWHRQAALRDAPPVWIDFPLTQNDLADALGLSLVHVNRQLMRLRREGVIEMRRRELRVLDMAALRAATEYDGGQADGFAA